MTRMAARPKCSLCGQFIICSCGGCASDTCKARCPHEKSSGHLAAISGKLGERPSQSVRGHSAPKYPRLDQLDGDSTD